MPRTYEKWEVQVGKNKYILSGEEKEAILMAREKGLGFVKFRDLVINPAFVQDMILLKSDSAGLLVAPKDGDLSEEDWLEKHGM